MQASTVAILFAVVLTAAAIYSTIRRERRIAADLAELARWRSAWARTRVAAKLFGPETAPTLVLLDQLKADVDTPDYGGAIGGA